MRHSFSTATRRVARQVAVVSVSAITLLGGCITGHEAEDAVGHDKARELEEARQLHEVGAISDAEYQLRKAEIERESER